MGMTKGGLRILYIDLLIIGKSSYIKTRLDKVHSRLRIIFIVTSVGIVNFSLFFYLDKNR